MNTFDNDIKHVKVPHIWHIVQYSYQHSVGLEKKKNIYGISHDRGGHFVSFSVIFAQKLRFEE